MTVNETQSHAIKTAREATASANDRGEKVKALIAELSNVEVAALADAIIVVASGARLNGIDREPISRLAYRIKRG